MKTRVTQLLGIEYPLIQGGMQHLGVPELAAAVSEAGGMGTINATIFPEPDAFRAAVREIKRLTKKPFCVNISLLPHVSVGPAIFEIIQICGEERVKAIETAGTHPKNLVAEIKSRGIVHIHKVPGVSYGLTAEKAGVDAVTVVGLECGGHPGKDEIGSLVLTNQAARSLKIPVIAGGGYADGRGMAAAFALGAEGVVMGTRFVAVQECPIHPHFKEWIVNASEKDTVLCQKSINNIVRVAKNTTAKECLALEATGTATLETLMPIIGGARGKAAYELGDTEGGLFPIGVGVGLINNIPTVKQAVEDILQDFNLAVHRLGEIQHG